MKQKKEVVFMMDFVKKGLAFGLGLAVTSKEQVEKLVNEWVKKGELSKEESKEMINQLIQRGEEEKNELKRIIREQLKQMMDQLDVATKEDINRLEQRILNLEKRGE
jgi:polyhydroxyalkanoate synthesis regulator phasin